MPKAVIAEVNYGDKTAEIPKQVQRVSRLVSSMHHLAPCNRRPTITSIFSYHAEAGKLLSPLWTVAPDTAILMQQSRSGFSWTCFFGLPIWEVPTESNKCM
jgi:hypothetical protein